MLFELSVWVDDYIVRLCVTLWCTGDMARVYLAISWLYLEHWAQAEVSLYGFIWEWVYIMLIISMKYTLMLMHNFKLIYTCWNIFHIFQQYVVTHINHSVCPITSYTTAWKLLQQSFVSTHIELDNVSCLTHISERVS